MGGPVLTLTHPIKSETAPPDEPRITASRPHVETGARRTWEMSATRVAPAEARRAVRDYAVLLDLPERQIEDIVLCVSEAVANVTQHAYRGREPGRCDIDASVDGDLRICVRDEGSGFTPRIGDDRLGLGLPIIARLTRSFHVRTMAAGGTELVMRFALPG